MIRLALGLSVVALFVIGARVVVAGRSELAAGEELEQSGDLDGAIIRYRRAAKWYLPGAPHGPEAIARLGAIAEQNAGATRRAAYRSIRAAAFAARSVFSPYEEALSEANAALGAADESGELRATLDADGRVGPAFIGAVALFWCFVVATFAFIRRESKDRLRNGLGVLAAAGFVGWLVTLVWA
ncbi:MAG: hypothetical protein AAF411_02535 [Myxococcota bacterium]